MCSAVWILVQTHFLCYKLHTKCFSSSKICCTVRKCTDLYQMSLKSLGDALRSKLYPLVLSMWPRQNISHPRWLVTYIFFFLTLPVKLKLGVQTIARLLLVVTHLNQSNYLANQQQEFCRELCTQSNYVTNQRVGVRLYCTFQHRKEKCWAKTILLSQTNMFWLLSSNFLLFGRILRTGGAVLMK